MLKINQLIGFGVAPDDVTLSWQPTMSEPLTGFVGSGGGYTNRMVLDSSLFSVSSVSHTRLSLKHDTGFGNTTLEMWLGQQAASGDVYDMASSPAPVRVTVGGVSNFTLVDGQTVDSDALAFVFDHTKNHVVTFYVVSGTVVLSQKTGVSAVTYHKFGVNDAATADVSGHSSTALDLLVVTGIDVS